MAPRTEPENWSRWPAHPQSWPLPVQQPAFVMEQSYTAHMIPMSTPQYPVPHGFVYGTYDTPETPTHPVASSTKHYLAERPIMGIHGQTQHSLPEPLQDNGHLTTKQPTLSPVIKSEPQPHEIPRGGETSANPVDGQVSDVKFATGIDRLLKIIQQRNDESGEKTSAAQTKTKARTNNNTATGLASRKRSKVATSNADPLEKPYACPRKKCHQRFSQVTQLHIHERSHTGESPHKCTYAGCGKRFTQKGNLRTHERRHRGERPFKCNVAGCTRAFPQKGNLAAHLDTHYKRNVFHCIFKSCGKSFSSRGNLKTHQNNYHEEELRALELKFSGVRSVTEMTKADQELWDYFLTVHKNSNKGIKGRGKECRVELLPSSNSTPHQYQLQSPVELQHAPYPVSHGLASSMNFGHYGMPRNNLGQDFLVSRGGHGHGHGYVYEIDQSSMSSGTLTPASSPGGIYDDHHHHRGVTYHDRVYEAGYARS